MPCTLLKYTPVELVEIVFDIQKCYVFDKDLILCCKIIIVHHEYLDLQAPIHPR